MVDPGVVEAVPLFGILHLPCKMSPATNTHPVLYCTVLYCIVLYCTARYCTVLYCTVLDLVLALLTVPVLDPPPLVHDPEAGLHPGTLYLQRPGQ